MLTEGRNDVSQFPTQSHIEQQTTAGNTIMASSTDIPEVQQQAEKTLWRWNLACAILHLVQAIAVLAVGLGSSRAGQFRIPQTTSFLGWNETLNRPVIDFQVRYMFPFVAVTSSFAWLSSAAHFAVLAFFKTYLAQVRKGRNEFRWYEYALSSSVMIVLIAMLFGVYDIFLLFSLGSLNATMNLFGLLMERSNEMTSKENSDWTAFVYGCFSGIVPWIVVFAYLGGSASGVSGIPAFVYAILASYFVMFNTFPINMILQYKQVGRWGTTNFGSGRGISGYYFGEKIYQILSLIAKSLLLWLVVGGANQPSAYIDSSQALSG